MGLITGTPSVHAPLANGGLFHAATNFIGNGIGSMQKFFGSTPATPPSPITNPAQSYISKPSQVPVISQPHMSPVLPAPLSNTTTTNNGAYQFDPAATQRMTQQNYAPVAQAEGALSTYLSSRDPAQYLQQQYTNLGIPDLQKAVSNYNGDILSQQNNLTDLPKQDISRRSDSGLLSAAQRARIMASEQAPLRDQLIKTQQAQSGASANLNGLLNLANNYLSAYNSGTNTGAQGLQTRVSDASNMYNAAQRQYEQGQQNQFNSGQAKQTTTAQEAMQNRQVQLAQGVTQEVKQGATLQQMMGKYLAEGLDPDTILSLYNANSPHGPATQSQYVPGNKSGTPTGDISKLYGVTSGRGLS